MSKKLEAQVKFIDLFAGIGGFHIAFEAAGAACVFTSEWDAAARLTYEHNFRKRSPRLFEIDPESGETPRFAGDITKVKLDKNPNGIEDFDILAGGFPCQPFSQAGLKKGMAETRGTLFFDILHILEKKRPAAYFLENVRGLMKHMSGDTPTIEIIRKNLLKLGYTFEVHLVWASDYGVPQHRPRLFMVGFLDPAAAERFTVPKHKPISRSLKEILGGKVNREIGYTLRVGGRGSGLQDRRNWDTYLVDGAALRIGPEHGLALQGFPKWFRFPSGVTETQAMKQLGNSVAVPAVTAFAKEIVKALKG